jgi:molybdopterin biosynthesis enzyme
MDSRVSDFLDQLLAISHPLEPFDMPLLDAHGASLAQDIFAGERLVLRAGSRIRSTQIGLAASIGLDRLPTRPHPRVVVISAGDDLVEPGQPLGDEEDEYETNSWLLTTAVREAGATGYRVHTIPENHAQLRQIVEDQLVRADLIVISGESQDESFALITGVLAEMGDITTVTPNLAESGQHNFGLIGPDKTPVVTLPGDPIGAFLSMEIFIRPMIRTMLGASNVFRNVLSLTLAESITSPLGKTSYIRAAIEANGTVIALPDQNDLLSLSDAAGLIAVPEKSEGYKAGEMVNVIILERSNN